MSRRRSLKEMISDVRKRSNTENSTFVDDDEIAEYLNQELAELWGLITQSSSVPFFRSGTQIDVVPDQSVYPLPDDFLEVQGVEVVLNGSTFRVRPFMPTERARLLNSQTSFPWAPTLKYRVQGDNIEFLPATERLTATVWYTPSCPRLEVLSDTFDGFNGWEVAAIYGAIATVQAKEDTDPSFYEGRKIRILKEVEAAAAKRDASEPERIQDVMGGCDDTDGMPWGFQ